MLRSAPYPGRIRADSYADLKRAGIPGSGDYRGPNTTYSVDGSRQMQWQCTRQRRGRKRTKGLMVVCGTRNVGEVSPLWITEVYCRRCRRLTEQERVG